MRFNTALLHDGADLNETHGATLPPVYQTSAFHHGSAEEMAAIFGHRAPGYNYTRVGNPSLAAFENRITRLEHGVSSIAFSSGMAAISGAVLNIAAAGDEIVASRGLYGGTWYLFKDLRSLGIATRFVDIIDRAAVEAACGSGRRRRRIRSILFRAYPDPDRMVFRGRLLLSAARR